LVNGFPESEKASIFDACDVFAMPSIAESFGIAYLEAWLCAKPVIGARIGAVQCVIEDGRDGLLVDPEDAGGLAGAILKLVRDADLRQRLGRRGQEKTLARFTWARITDAIEAVYLEAIERSTASPR
jgi:glycosyltransferase involved in cell wall biosynthesis